jgi:hypothetical protein
MKDTLIILLKMFAMCLFAFLVTLMNNKLFGMEITNTTILTAYVGMLSYEVLKKKE